MTPFKKRRRLLERAENRAFKKYQSIIDINEKNTEKLVLNIQRTFNESLRELRKIQKNTIKDIKQEFTEAITEIKNTNNLNLLQQKSEFDRIEKSRQKEVDERIKTLDKKIESLNTIEQQKFDEQRILAGKNARFDALLENVEEKNYNLRKDYALLLDNKKQRDVILENGQTLIDSGKEVFVNDEVEGK